MNFGAEKYHNNDKYNIIIIIIINCYVFFNDGAEPLSPPALSSFVFFLAMTDATAFRVATKELMPRAVPRQRVR